MATPEKILGYDRELLETTLKNYLEAAAAIQSVLAMAGIAVLGSCGRQQDAECGMKDAAECSIHRELPATALVLN